MLISPLLNGVSIASVETTKACRFDVSVWEKKLWTLLYVNEDFKAAGRLVDEAQMCATSKYHAAVLAEMRGTVGLALHRHTGDIDYANDAEKLFLEGLRLNTEHDDVLYWRLASLMRQTEQYERAVTYLNPLLQKDSKYTPEHLSLALEVAVETRNWDQAKDLVDVLYSKYRNFILNIPVLYASVKTLCHYNRKDLAGKFIAAVEKHRSGFSAYEQKLLNASKIELTSHDCRDR